MNRTRVNCLRSMIVKRGASRLPTFTVCSQCANGHDRRWVACVDFTTRVSLDAELGQDGLSLFDCPKFENHETQKCEFYN